MILRLNYPPPLVRQPVIATLAEKYRLTINILRARVTSDEGWLIVDMTGSAKNIAKALEWLRNEGLEVIVNPPMDAEQ